MNDPKPAFKRIATIWLLGAVTTLSGCWVMPFSEAPSDATSSSTEDYAFDPKNVADIGTVYHYEKSNQDGSKKAQVWMYLASPSRTESFKIYPLTWLQGKTDLVIADYDLSLFYAKSVEAYLVGRDGGRELNASTTSSDGEIFKTTYKGSTSSFTVGHTPAYNYNFDWCDLAFMYRHLKDKEKDFAVGVTVPDSSLKMIYAGKAELAFNGYATHLSHHCRSYKVSGEAFHGETGTLLADSTTGALMLIDMPVRNNGNYSSFKLSFVDSFVCDDEGWKALIAQKTDEAL
jgi:hypothetical protein